MSEATLGMAISDLMMEEEDNHGICKVCGRISDKGDDVCYSCRNGMY